MNKILINGGFRLRPAVQKDISSFVKWVLDPSVLKWTMNGDIPDERLRKAIIRDITNEIKKRPRVGKVFVIEEKISHLWKPIGVCVLGDIRDRNRSAVFAICLSPDQWRQGYGTEATKLLLDYAFEKMQMHRVESHVSEYNTQSLKFHESFGFIEECRSKEACFQNSWFWDRIIFRLLETEWQALKKKRGW